MSAPRLRFGLVGPSIDLDARTHALRGDLADVALAGKLFAPHFAEPVAMASARRFTPMLSAIDGAQNSELLADEHFMMLDSAGSWAWGWSAHDHYVGYVEACALGRTDGLAPDVAPGDPVDIARGFLGTTYLWGGRGGAGIDCSGLVQRALSGIGIAAPRDSDMQHEELGQQLPGSSALERGDLIFFPGHVGMMSDATTLIHATRHHGKVVEEPLAEVAARILAKKGEAILARKRVTA